MPLDRLVLILVVVFALAGATVFVAALVAATDAMPWLTLAVLAPLGLGLRLVLRVVSDRRANREDDR